MPADSAPRGARPAAPRDLSVPVRDGERTMPQQSDVTYQNPVWPGYFADPFALKAADGAYYAYGTGPVGADGRPFPILKSTNLVQWELVGGALQPLPGDVPMN